MWKDDSTTRVVEINDNSSSVADMIRFRCSGKGKAQQQQQTQFARVGGLFGRRKSLIAATLRQILPHTLCLWVFAGVLCTHSERTHSLQSSNEYSLFSVGAKIF